MKKYGLVFIILILIINCASCSRGQNEKDVNANKSPLVTESIHTTLELETPNSITPTNDENSDSIKEDESLLARISEIEESLKEFDSDISVQLERLGYIRSALKSFTDMTKKGKDKFTAEELKSIGNTDETLQEIGFYNYLLDLEYKLKSQQVYIKGLQYELAIKKYQDNKISKEEYDKFMKDYTECKNSFDSYKKEVKSLD